MGDEVRGGEKDEGQEVDAGVGLGKDFGFYLERNGETITRT